MERTPGWDLARFQCDALNHRPLATLFDYELSNRGLTLSRNPPATQQT
ncbi:hypothetical protein HEP74_03541 [Xanthomonas sp. SS]|nr:hypothetical protein HEP74_03541 [Xanthomonas sp. SS]